MCYVWIPVGVLNLSGLQTVSSSTVWKSILACIDVLYHDVAKEIDFFFKLQIDFDIRQPGIVSCLVLECFNSLCMCYQFNHNEQEAQWQSDIIYSLELTHWGCNWKIAGNHWK